MRWSAAALVAVALAAAPAAADPPADAARSRELYQLGRQRFEAGDLERAIDAFQQGYALDPRPEFLLNLAQSYRALGRRAEAIAHLERFIAAAPDHPLRPAAEKTLAELRREEAAARAEARPLPLVPVQKSAPPAPERRRSRVWIWAAAGAAVVLGGAAAIYLATRPDDSPHLIDTVPLPE
jgi:tetratricopeptide (TPR) repeat protein